MTNSKINSIKNSRFIQPIRVNNNFFREKIRKNGTTNFKSNRSFLKVAIWSNSEVNGPDEYNSLNLHGIFSAH